MQERMLLWTVMGKFPLSVDGNYDMVYIGSLHGGGVEYGYLPICRRK